MRVSKDLLLFGAERRASMAEGPQNLVSAFGFRVSGFGFRVSEFGFRVSGFGFGIRGSGSRVYGFEQGFQRNKLEQSRAPVALGVSV